MAGLAKIAACDALSPKDEDARLRRGIEAMFFAYRAFTSDPDRILAGSDLGRAHHRALHFIDRAPGSTVSSLLGVLGVTKQSLNRVLRRLIEDGLVDSRIGPQDKRERHLYLTPAGTRLQRELARVQSARMRAAFAQAGPQAVEGFFTVLQAMMDPDHLRHFRSVGQGDGSDDDRSGDGGGGGDDGDGGARGKAGDGAHGGGVPG